MSEIIFSSCQLTCENSASEYFSNHRCDIGVIGGIENTFDYATRMCKIGNTTISRSESSTGWAYEKRAELDGFLLTVPDSGRVSWRTAKNNYESRRGAVFVSDQREIVLSSFSQQANYTCIFLHYDDVIRCINSLVDEAPRARVCFYNGSPDVKVGGFLANMAETVLSLPAELPLVEGPFLNHLKDSLISYTIYNIENNYSRIIRSTDTVRMPTPHCIKSTVEYINSYFSEELTLTGLAARANVSVRGLQVGFKKYRDTTIVRYIREIRLSHARKMISDTSLFLSLKQIAFACGFTNYYLFCKYYSSRFAEPPLETLRRSRTPGL
jgi:AraC-like DNA-binding protein